MSPVQLLECQGPRSSGTRAFPVGDGAMGGNNSTLPGLPPQPAPGALDKHGEEDSVAAASGLHE